MNKYTSYTISIIIIFGLLGCNRNYYVDPLSKLINSDQQLINGSYNPMNNVIDYCYTTNLDSVLDGPFIWNKYYESEIQFLSKYFESEMYQSATYISGNFREGELVGKILLMRSQTSSPKQEEIDTVGYYNYKLGQLDGDFELTRFGEIYLRGNYDNGKLKGELFHKEGGGIFNGLDTGSTFKWQLNYQKGVFDSVQTLYIYDTIVEMLYFEEGVLTKVINGWKDRGFVRVDNDQHVYKLNSSSLYFSLFGRMLEKDHTSKIRSEKFGDSGFNGEIKFCDGRICNDTFTITRIIDYNGIPSREETFNLDE